MTASPGALDLVIEASKIDGVIPLELRGGRLLSNGPGWTLIGDRLAHPFDGHGYLRAFSFEHDGSVKLRARFIHTPAYQSESAAQRITHKGLGTNVGDHFWQNLRQTGARNVANTTIMRWNGQLLAGWEGGAPYAIDPNTLETLGEQTFEGALAGQATLAHMKHDAAQGRLVTCSAKMGRTTTLTFREMDATGVVVQTRTVAMPTLLFAHDFAITPNWYVMAGNPLKMKWGELARTLVGASTMMNAIAIDAHAAGALYLIPRRGDGSVRTVTLPQPTFVVHIGNAFETTLETAGIVQVDACLFHQFEFGAEFGFQGPSAPLDPGLPDQRVPQRLFRISIPAAATHGTWQQLAPHGVDFPRVHPMHDGRDTALLFGATRADIRHSDPFDSVLRIDLRALNQPPHIWTAEDNVFVGEPVFAPSIGRDDAGHVLVILSDGVEARTTLAIFDASNIAAGPLARVPMPLLPVAFHGTWDPAEHRVR